MSIQAAKDDLARFGRDGDVIEFEESSATVDMAAAQIGVDAQIIAKTLAIYSADRAHAILIVVAGDARLNSGDFKRRFGHKPSFLKPEDVEPLSGHPIGGVCPFGNPASAEVWLDESLRRFDRVFPAAGAHNSAIGIDVADLDEVAGASGWVAVTRVPEP
ncbi:MAG: YbaK/EbsC family protein [Microbacterium sp.]